MGLASENLQHFLGSPKVCKFALSPSPPDICLGRRTGGGGVGGGWGVRGQEV